MNHATFKTDGQRRSIQNRVQTHHRLAGRRGVSPPSVQEAQTLSRRRKLQDSAAEIEEKEIEWLWPGFIAGGMVTALVGPNDIGKSLIMMNVAARVSKGWPMPPGRCREQSNEPGAVMVLNAEDSPERVIIPRLKLAGANLELITIPRNSSFSTSTYKPVIPELTWHIDRLKDLTAKDDIRLVIIDPLKAHLAYATANNNPYREYLQDLSVLAEDTGAAVVAICPTAPKAQTHKYLFFRSVLRAFQTKRDLRLLKVERTPYSRGGEVLPYAIEAEKGKAHPWVRWGHPADISAEDLLEVTTSRKRTAAERAADDIRSAFVSTSADGQIPSKDLDEMLREFGHTRNAILDGRKLAGVQAYRKGSSDGKWWCHLGEAGPNA